MLLSCKAYHVSNPIRESQNVFGISTVSSATLVSNPIRESQNREKKKSICIYNVRFQTL